MTQRFVAPLFYFSAIIASIALLISWLLPDPYITPALPLLIPFFMAVTYITFRFLEKSLAQKFIRFLNTYLLSVIVKLFLYVTIMVTYAWLYRVDAVPFLLAFFALYLVYTIYEAVAIIRISRKPGS